jgi:hypothetical protein
MARLGPRLTVLLLALVGTGFSASAQQAPDTTLTAIRAGRLIDPTSGVVSRNQVILVRGKKIAAVGPT